MTLPVHFPTNSLLLAVSDVEINAASGVRDWPCEFTMVFSHRDFLTLAPNYLKYCKEQWEELKDLAVSRGYVVLEREDKEAQEFIATFRKTTDS